MTNVTNPKTNQPFKILWYGDGVALSGFGRIANEVCRRLKRRGYSVQLASIQYTGHPTELIKELDWVWALGGRDIWNEITGIVNYTQPDILISCQDFPYHVNLFHGCRIDFSKLKWIGITPVDGVPIDPGWLKIIEQTDGFMTISEFGVEAFRQEGKRVDLCHPAADANEFYPLDDVERAKMREIAGYKPDDYVVGVVAMNQGRKAIPPMIEAFYEFAKDKPNAKLYLDMDDISPAGWHIPNLLKQMKWSEDEQKRIKYKKDMFTHPELLPLVNRYALMDAHMVISHREGFGLPLMEAQACRIPVLALDYCSGTEICGDGRGLLVKTLPYREYGTWGGAKDCYPDTVDLIVKLNQLYNNPAEAKAIAERGYQWARSYSWDTTTDEVERVIQAALAKDRKVKAQHDVTNPATEHLNDDRGRDSQAVDALRDYPVIQPTAKPDPLPDIVSTNGG